MFQQSFCITGIIWTNLWT